MSKLSPQLKAAHDSLILLGEAKERDDADAYSLAYDSYMRALRAMDTASFDADIVDDYGNVMKPAGKFNQIESYERAWGYKLPEDG